MAYYQLHSTLTHSAGRTLEDRGSENATCLSGKLPLLASPGNDDGGDSDKVIAAAALNNFSPHLQKLSSEPRPPTPRRRLDLINVRCFVRAIVPC